MNALSVARLRTMSIALSAWSALLGACGEQRDYRPQVRGGDAQRGQIALLRHDCGVCHAIPGIIGAHGRVGPSLASYGRFPHLAGKFPNDPELLVRWLTDAPSMAVATAMPALDLDEQEARDMAAYLYSLE